MHHHNYYEAREIQADYFFDDQMSKYEHEAIEQFEYLFNKKYVPKLSKIISQACLNEDDNTAASICDILELSNAHLYAVLGNKHEFIKSYEKQIF